MPVPALDTAQPPTAAPASASAGDDLGMSTSIGSTAPPCIPNRAPPVASAAASPVQVPEAAGLAPYPLPTRAPPCAAGAGSADNKSLRGSGAAPPLPMPSRVPPAPPTRPPPSLSSRAQATSKPSMPRAFDVPQEVLGDWSYWTEPEASPPTPLPVSTQSVPPPPAPMRPPPRPASAASGERRLPGDWLEHTDSCTDCKYYFSFECQASQWGRPLPSDMNGDLVLPPGWRRAWCSLQGRWFYMDIQLQVSQWEPPGAYVHRNWRRQVDENGEACWACSTPDSAAKGCEAFYESDEAWQRFVDLEDRPYWSCIAQGVRFFEAP